MSEQTIQLRKNNTNAEAVPSSLLLGEVAVNLLDRSLFSYDGTDVVKLYTGDGKYFDADGKANDALKLDGQLPAYFATAQSVTELGAKLDKMFAVDEANNAVHVNGDNYKNFYADGEISAGGMGDGSGSSISFDRLDAWADYTTDKSGYVLSAGLGYDLHDRLSGIEADAENWLVTSDLSTYLANNGYATEDWVKTYVSENASSGGTVSGDYLPLTGGTISSAERHFVLTVDGSYGTETSIAFSRSGTIKSVIGHQDAYGTMLFNANATSRLYMPDDGGIYFDGKTLLHTGNLSAYGVRTAYYSTNVDCNSAAINAFTHAYQWTNSPAGGIATLIDATYSADWRTQLFISHAATPELRMRSRYNGTTWGDWKTLLDSSNYSSYALPLSGGTINGMLTVNGGSTSNTPFIVDTSLTAQVGMRFNDQGTYKAWYGWEGPTGGYGATIYNATNGNKIILKDTSDAVKYVFGGAEYTSWHSGNDGSGSGLDADLLDGKDGWEYRPMYDLGGIGDYGIAVIGLCKLDNSSIGAQYWSYGDVYIHRMNGLSGAAASSIRFSCQKIYNTTNAAFSILTQGVYYTNKCTFTYGGVKYAGLVINPGAAQVTSVKICGYFHTVPFMVTYYNSRSGVQNSEINSSIVINGSDVSSYPYTYGTFAGSLSGNASSATKLATARTIWGQSFDGTGNVSGNLHIDTAKFYWHGDSSNYYIACPTATGGAMLNYMAYSGHAFLGGNVGIGTTSPSYKLHVEGDVYVKGGIKSYNAIYTHHSDSGNYPQIDSYGNEIVFGCYTGNSLYVNYRTSSNRPNAVTSWLWFAGSSSAYASFYLGSITSYGNLSVTGTAAAKTSSDRRLKTNFDYSVDYGERLLSLGRVCDFEYTEEARNRKLAFADDKRHTGLIWQEARKAGLADLCSVEEDGYGTINYLSTDLATTLIGAVQGNIIGLRSLMKSTESLEERVKRLERENKRLKGRIKLLEGGIYGK